MLLTKNIVGVCAAEHGAQRAHHSGAADTAPLGGRPQCQGTWVLLTLVCHCYAHMLVSHCYAHTHTNTHTHTHIHTHIYTHARTAHPPANARGHAGQCRRPRAGQPAVRAGAHGDATPHAHAAQAVG